MPKKAKHVRFGLGIVTNQGDLRRMKGRKSKEVVNR